MLEVNAIKLPTDIGIERELREDATHVDKGPLNQSDLEQYDKDTVFYDFFINKEESNLIGIGPPLLNLRKALSPLKLWMNGRKISYHLTEIDKKRISILKSRIPRNLLKDRNRVRLEFANIFHWEGIIVAEEPQQPETMTLCTLQKNNKLEWILDWVYHYKKNFNIKQIVIYDNGSDNINELIETVSDEATILNWDFPYGPFRSHSNQFCQIGALNHCRLKFARHGIMFNFDIDELLVTEEKYILNRLEKNSTLYFDSYWMSNVKPSKDTCSFQDFTLSEVHPRHNSYKYICKADDVDYNKTHSTSKFKYHIFAKRLKKNQEKYISTSEGYFLHFRGITTNWRAIVKSGV